MIHNQILVSTQLQNSMKRCSFIRSNVFFDIIFGIYEMNNENVQSKMIFMCVGVCVVNFFFFFFLVCIPWSCPNGIDHQAS